MRKAWRAIKVYFGLAEPDAPRTIEIRWVRSNLAQLGAGLVALAAAGALGVIVVYGHGEDGLAGLALGVVAFGIGGYFLDIREHVPGEPMLRLPEAEAVVPSAEIRRQLLKRFFTTLPLILPVLMLANEFGANPAWAFLPGQLLGYAVAHFVGVAQVALWERSRGSRVAARFADGRVTALYAVPRG